MNYNSIFQNLLWLYFCYIVSRFFTKNIFVQFIKIIKVHEQNSTCCTMGNLTHDIFAKIRQPLSSSHQKYPHSTCTDTFKTKH